MAPSGKKKEKPKERLDAATVVSHFVKRKKTAKENSKKCVYHCARGTTTSDSAHDADSKNQYL